MRSHERKLLTFSQCQRVLIVKEVCLIKSTIAIIYSLNSNIGLRKPLSLYVNSLLGISFFHKVLTHQIRKNLRALLINRSCNSASHSHSSSLLQQSSWLWLTEKRSVLGWEITLLMLTVMLWKDTSEAFSGSTNWSINLFNLTNILFIDNWKNMFRLIFMNSWVYHNLLVRRFKFTESVIRYQTLSLLLRFTIVRT